MRVVPLVLAPMFLFATEASDKCPMGGVAAVKSSQSAYHSASAVAELVAPSGRRRAVTAPTNPGATQNVTLSPAKLPLCEPRGQRRVRK